MKFSLGQHPPSNRTEAWACATANLAFPGSGSLAAGKVIGYGQIGVALFGMIISFVTSVRLVQWMSANWVKIHRPDADPVETLGAIGHAIEWPLVGLAIFVFALAWAGVTSFQIIAATPKGGVPPRIVS